MKSSSRASIALDRIRAGKPARSFVLYGLRGVGKTVLLNKIRSDAEVSGMWAVPVEAPEDRSLPGLLAPPLRSVLLRMSKSAVLTAHAKAAMGALASFVSALKVKYADLELGVNVAPERGGRRQRRPRPRSD